MIIGFDARLYGIHHRGIGRYCSSLLDQISQIDEINKYLLFANDDKIPHKFKSWQIVRAPYQAYSFSEQLNFYFTLRKYNHDLMHFPHWNIPVIYKQPYVVTIHDLILHYFSNERVTALPLWRYNLKINLYFKVIKRVIKKACKIIAVSESTAKDIVKFYPFAEKKISVIYEAPTIDGRHYNNQVSPRLIPREYLLNVGAAYPHKNLEQLISVFSKIVKNNPNLVLVLVGRHDFFYQRLQQQVIKQQLEKNIIFWGEAQEPDLAILYKYALCYIAPSLAEGFNLGAVEALSFNTPVLASNISVHQEILKDAAIYFNPLSADNLQEQLLQIINQADLRKNLAAKSQAVITNYSWQKAARETIACYQSVI